jgi:hypothetical protein
MAGREDSDKLMDERCHRSCPTHLFMAPKGAAATYVRWDGLEKTARSNNRIKKKRDVTDKSETWQERGQLELVTVIADFRKAGETSTGKCFNIRLVRWKESSEVILVL